MKKRFSWAVPLALSILLANNHIVGVSKDQERLPNRVTVPPEFVGTWKLHSYEVPRPNGEILYPHGDAPVGLLIYERSGYMSVQIMTKSRDEKSASIIKSKQIYKSDYLAYFGRYEVDMDKRVIIHHVEASTDARRVGRDLMRPFILSDDRLTLAPVFVEDGERRTHRVTWARVGKD
jgi:catechol 1,2-dioxygenase